MVSFHVGFGTDVREAGGAQCFSPPPLPEVAAWGLLPEEGREGRLPAVLRRADSAHETTVVCVQVRDSLCGCGSMILRDSAVQLK